MKLATIPAGEFVMGSPAYEEGREPDETPHRVRITTPFLLSVCEVTVCQFRRFAEETDYRTDAERDPHSQPMADGATWRSPGYAQADDHPVVFVSWNDAAEFCRWLSRKESFEYRLPTEAEWEYACRAGTTTRFHTGDPDGTLSLAANTIQVIRKASGAVDLRRPPSLDFLRGASAQASVPVGRLKPNDFGLFDMHGNVWEWCLDWYDAGFYGKSPGNDPAGPAAGERRVLRGGCGETFSWYARSANRSSAPPSFRHTTVGFRIARACR